MGRKRAGFEDVMTTRAAFERDEVRCGRCKTTVGPRDEPRFVRTFGTAQPTLATITCPRCHTTVSIRFVEEAPAAER